MTPQERELISQLFDRLATLEDRARDQQAEDAIEQGLDRAPHAPYALVQTVLVQDEALKRANDRIKELEAELGIDEQPAQPQGGFLDSMRDSVFGRRDAAPSAGRGSVPSVRPGETPMGVPPGFRTGMQPDGPSFAGQFQQGQTLEQAFQIQPGKCYSVIGVGVGITELDVQIVLHQPPLPPYVAAQDQGTGPQAVLGGKGQCFKNPLPVGGPAKVVMTATGGAGIGMAQVYSK